MSTLRLPAQAAMRQRLRAIRWWQVLLVLALLGQFLGPLFVSARVWPFAPIGRLIYWLGAAICPDSAGAPIFLGRPMIVCLLCSGALIAVTAVTFSYPRPPGMWRAWRSIPSLAHFAVIAALIAPWLWGYIEMTARLAMLSQPAMFALGLVGGLGVALLVVQMRDLSAPVRLEGR
jgi:hypothetical protein